MAFAISHICGSENISKNISKKHFQKYFKTICLIQKYFIECGFNRREGQLSAAKKQTKRPFCTFPKYFSLDSKCYQLRFQMFLARIPNIFSSDAKYFQLRFQIILARMPNILARMANIFTLDSKLFQLGWQIFLAQIPNCFSLDVKELNKKAIVSSAGRNRIER